MEKKIPGILHGTSIPVFCPLCQANLNINHSNSIRCLNGHQYDTGTSGYINLRTESVQPSFNDHSLKTSDKLTVNGLSEKLERIFLQLLYAEYAINDSLTILDAGAGDGRLFSNILFCMRWDQHQHQGIGICDSVPLGRTAPDQQHHAIWLEACIEKMPLKNDSVDVILNTLTTSCYAAFSRVLKPGGLLLKTILVTELSGELKELGSHTEFNIEHRIEISGSHTILCCRKRW